MEPVKIDWKNLEWKFVEDHVYEHFNAPKWVDFSSPNEPQQERDQPGIDELWFCRPDCNHPKTVQDFYKSPSSSKLLNSLVNRPEILQFSPNRRGEKLKRRGGNQQAQEASTSDSKCYSDLGENTDPNTLNTPITHHVKSVKQACKSKSSNEKKIFANDSKGSAHNNETPRRLESTLSTRNLFAGKDIFNHITDFCNELKKLATRAKERENEGAENTLKTPAVDEYKHIEMDNGILNENVKERKPLLEVTREKQAAIDKSYCREAFRTRREANEAENSPMPVDLKNIKKMDYKSLQQIRTSPPTPQCFSAIHGAKTSKTKGMERNILQQAEAKQEKTLERRKSCSSKNVANFAEKEAKTLDVFWFLKPCTLPS